MCRTACDGRPSSQSIHPNPLNSTLFDCSSYSDWAFECSPRIGKCGRFTHRMKYSLKNIFRRFFSSFVVWYLSYLYPCCIRVPCCQANTWFMHKHIYELRWHCVYTATFPWRWALLGLYSIFVFVADGSKEKKTFSASHRCTLTDFWPHLARVMRPILRCVLYNFCFLWSWFCSDVCGFLNGIHAVYITALYSSQVMIALCPLPLVYSCVPIARTNKPSFGRATCLLLRT